MSPLAALSTMALWAGAALALSELRWFRRITLLDRTAPFVPGGIDHLDNRNSLQRTLRDTIAPASIRIGRCLARWLGMRDDPVVRLRRIGQPDRLAEFRSKQVGAAGAALISATLFGLIAMPPAPLAVTLIVGAPLGMFLWHEHRLNLRSERHRNNVTRELPVVAEHLGMLLGAGLPLTVALERTAQRGQGATARDLRLVVQRIHSGASPAHALHSWADLMDIPALARLTGILDLHQDTSTIAVLISDEARSMRRDAHRRLLARIERRNEQVWIPVTVATLVPGVAFLAVPFVDALGSFAEL